jgi:hypothetical protein
MLSWAKEALFIEGEEVVGLEAFKLEDSPANESNPVGGAGDDGWSLPSKSNKELPP